MLTSSKAYSGFAVPDLAQAQAFYGETLGLDVTDIPGAPLISLNLPGDRTTLIYEKADHAPANYTILNFPVADVEAEVDELAGRGIEFERYDGFNQDEKGISHDQGPTIAWFTDPAGNILAVHEEQ
jgi:catechol 2,3-dioxygenase-like lactoylglutathione lyase family enzyme